MDMRVEEFEFLVPKYRKMDPMTEDVLPSSQDLQNGMMVLVESSSEREDLHGILKDHKRQIHANVANRWCSVSKLERTPLGVTFLGTYADGGRCTRKYGDDTSWLVKLNSVASSGLRQDIVYDAVREAIAKYDAFPESKNSLIAEATKKILEALV